MYYMHVAAAFELVSLQTVGSIAMNM